LRARDDLDLEKPSMKAVGYRQIWQYLDGEYDLAEARLKGIYATRQLAKRQYTWLRRMTDIAWYDPIFPAENKRLIDEISRQA
jgi:tRNA dimethylallyltransferase